MITLSCFCIIRVTRLRGNMLFPEKIELLSKHITWPSYAMTCRVTPLSGFHGCLAGFLVALKQLLPNLELPMCFFWKIKAKVYQIAISKPRAILYLLYQCTYSADTYKLVDAEWSYLFVSLLLLQWMPFFVVCFSSIMAFIVPDSINFLPTLVSGMYVSWLYLRYFQRNPLTGLKGDPSDDFSFPSLFPAAMRYFESSVIFSFYISKRSLLISLLISFDAFVFPADQLQTLWPTCLIGCCVQGQGLRKWLSQFQILPRLQEEGIKVLL